MPGNDLLDFMNSATKQMAEEYKRIQKRSIEDPGTAGDQGEENWATLLRNWLPTTFHIVTKGRILSHNGIASPQVDVIILQPEYPSHLLDKKLYLAGGVLAAFECKVTLKSHHLDEFIKNSIEIKQHFTKQKGTPYKELQSPIIYGMLAHSHSWKGKKSNPIQAIEKKLHEADNKSVTHPIQMPDLICVADLAFWSAFKMTFFGPRFIPDWSKMVDLYGTNGSATSGFTRHSKSTQVLTKDFTPIGAFISSLLNKLAWQVTTLRALSQYFNSVNLTGMGEGAMRMWDSEIYSDEIRAKVESGHFRSGEPWDEWVVYF
ncbi:MAG TPA: DUF6602 domain-containing protein [Mucilaginibacter sp.]|nr:DUF6602 domain-containing protein [Mucilaginibacter sp.]